MKIFDCFAVDLGIVCQIISNDIKKKKKHKKISSAHQEILEQNFE